MSWSRMGPPPPAHQRSDRDGRGCAKTHGRKGLLPKGIPRVTRRDAPHAAGGDSIRPCRVGISSRLSRPNGFSYTKRGVMAASVLKATERRINRIEYDVISKPPA